MSTTEQNAPPVGEIMQALADEAAQAAEAEAEVTSLTLDEAVENIADGSRTAEGITFASLVERVTERMVAVKIALVSHTQARKDTALALADTARAILLPSGVPDWALDSQAAQTVVHYSLDKVLDSMSDVDKGERKRERNAIMAHYTRWARDLAMRAYVAEETTQLDQETGETSRLFPDGPDDTNEMFLAYVRKQYVDSGVGVKAMPGKYKTPEDKQASQPSGAGPGGGGNAMESVRKGIDSLKGIAVRYAAVALLRGVSNLVQSIIKNEVQYGTEENKKAVSEVLRRVGVVSYYGAKAIDGKGTADDAVAVTESFWKESDETFDAE